MMIEFNSAVAVARAGHPEFSLFCVCNDCAGLESVCVVCSVRTANLCEYWPFGVTLTSVCNYLCLGIRGSVHEIFMFTSKLESL